MREDTDLADPEASVTTEFQHATSSEAPELAFRDVAVELGVDFRHGPGRRTRLLPEDTGSGVAWGDYDGDGDDDLYLVNFPNPEDPLDPTGNNRLWRNDGGRFYDVTERAGVADLGGNGMGAGFADFDGDSDLDLFVANYGADRLFENRGDGTFRDLAPALGLAGDGWSISPVWGDVDRDGRLDLYVTRYVKYDAPAPEPVATDPNWESVPFSLNPNSFDSLPNRLYLQQPDGTFEESALVLGVANAGGRTLGASFVDVDGDGWLDLYVANDVSPNALFRNLGGDEGYLTFDDWSAVTGTADERGSMGISVADLFSSSGGPDGRPDLFISHWVAQENALYVSTLTETGRLEYRDRIRQYRLGEVSTDRVGWGTAFVDFDLDGRLDIAVANGSTLEVRPSEERAPKLEAQPAFFFWNGGDRFYDVTTSAGADAGTARVARGLATSDFDLDGDSDLAISVNRGAFVLLRNESEHEAGASGGSWLAVRLATTDALAIGSRIEVRTGETLDTRFVGADASYASLHSREQVFGLGEDSRATVSIKLAGSPSLRFLEVPAGHRMIVPVRSL